jgi:hypothetical protein
LDNLRQLLGVEIAALTALAIVSICAAFVMQLAELSLFAGASGGHFRGWFFGLMLVGTPIALLYGGPAYFFLRRRALARWGYVTAIGLLPAFVFFAMAPLAGALCLVCGISVAGLTHILCRNRV